MTRYLDALKAWVEANRSDLIFWSVEMYLVMMLFVGLFVMASIGAMAYFTPVPDSLRDLTISGFSVYFAAIYLCIFLWAAYALKETLCTGTKYDEMTLLLGSIITLATEGTGATVALLMICAPYLPVPPGHLENFALVAVGTAAYCVLGYRRRYADLIAHTPSSPPEPGA